MATKEEKVVQLLKQEFPTVEEFVKNWLKTYLHDTPDSPRFFMCSNSYMKITEMLEKMDAFTSSPCAIFDTDIRTQLSSDGGLQYKYINFFICAHSEDGLDEAANEEAKKYCNHIVEEFRKFYLSAKKMGNKNVRTLEEIGESESGVPFLDGWQNQNVNLRYIETFCAVPNFNEY